MNDEPNRVLSNKNPVDWVYRRASCTDKDVFSWLFNQVKSDVESVNNIGKRNQRRIFSILGNGARGKFDVCRGQEPAIEGVMVQFTLRDGQIEIETQLMLEPRTFALTREWNLDNAECILHLDNKPMALWEISQRVLYETFFNSPAPDAW